MKQAEVINKKIYTENKPFENTLIILKSENGKEELKIQDSDLFYIESADNYSNIVFLERNKQKKTLIRNSLKQIEDQLKHPYIIRSHRSFLVNLSKVKSISGNSQGYQLCFDEIPEMVPVSRKAGKELLEKLELLKNPTLN